MTEQIEMNFGEGFEPISKQDQDDAETLQAWKDALDRFATKK